jgi:hypothetical protein
MTEKRQDDNSRAVIPDLIRNLYYCQKTQILAFARMTKKRQNDKEASE